MSYRAVLASSSRTSGARASRSPKDRASQHAGARENSVQRVTRITSAGARAYWHFTPSSSRAVDYGVAALLLCHSHFGLAQVDPSRGRVVMLRMFLYIQ
jgi:hypothetical protein